MVLAVLSVETHSACCQPWRGDGSSFSPRDSTSPSLITPCSEFERRFTLSRIPTRRPCWLGDQLVGERVYAEHTMSRPVARKPGRREMLETNPPQ